MNQIKLRMGPVEWALLLLLSVIWGGSFLLNGLALRSFPPIFIAASRVVIGAAALGIFAAATGRLNGGLLKYWHEFLVMGLLNNALPFTLIIWGQQQIASGLASILNASTPLFTVIVAHLWTQDERMSVARVSGIVVGLLGVAVIVGLDLFKGDLGSVPAQLAVVSATISYSFASVFGRRFSKSGLKPIETTIGQVAASSLVMVPLALVLTPPWTFDAPVPEAVFALVGLGILCTSVAFLIYFRLLASSGATNVVSVTLLIPFSAIAMGAIFLGEQLEASHFAGLALIILGLLILDGRVFGLLRKRGKGAEI